MNKTSFRDYWIPLALFLLFFVVEVVVKPSELILTFLAIFFTGIIFKLDTRKNEVSVFLLGLFIGLFIEVALGLIARQQYWTNASLFGVPFWLPLTWGIGFVVITRVGIRIEGLKWKKK